MPVVRRARVPYIADLYARADMRTGKCSHARICCDLYARVARLRGGLGGALNALSWVRDWSRSAAGSLLKRRTAGVWGRRGAPFDDPIPTCCRQDSMVELQAPITTIE